MTWLGIDIETWLSIIGTALKVLVALGGGLWAFFLLFHLRKRAQADAAIENDRWDTEKKKDEIQISHIKLLMDYEKHRIGAQSEEAKIKELEFKIRKQVSVSVDIQVDMSSASQDYIVIVTVALTNHGNEATKIAWVNQPPAFSVRHVAFDNDGLHHGPSRDFPVMSTRDPTIPALSHIIRAGTTETLTFAFQPEQPGLYLLSFRGAVDEDVRKGTEIYGIRMPTAWTAKRYVFVSKALQSATQTNVC
jgi:hypothetical protein